MPNKTARIPQPCPANSKGTDPGIGKNWTDYLTTASRLYKYSYADQLMIYAQRPDATACASFDLWNDRMNRYIRRGSKGHRSVRPVQQCSASALRFRCERYRGAP